MIQINIGIYEESLQKSPNSIANVLKSNALLHRIPCVLKKLSSAHINRVDYLSEFRDIDILFIENKYEVNIYICTSVGYRQCYECKKYYKAKFAQDSNRIIYALLYRVIEIKDFYIYVRNDTGYFKLYFYEIAYIEIENRATIIHCTNDNIVTYKSLRHYVDLLDRRFIRCHASFIVNADYIVKIEYPYIILIDGRQVLMSKHKRHSFLEAYKSYIH